MSHEILQQQSYWNNTVSDFDAIYSHKKGTLENFLDRYFRWDMYARYEYTLKHSEPIVGKSFLDIGCGTGVYSVELAKRGARKVIGLDIAQNMLDVCRKRSESAGVAQCEFIHSDLIEYRPDSKFDVSIGIGLFDYIRDPLPVLKKMHELTSEKIIISVPRLWTWRAPVRKVRLGLKGCSVYFYSRRRSEELLRQAGFHDARIDTVGKLFCITAAV